MATSEIEKLERRYAENPQGLTFAPLAEVHRKNGDIPRALELLRAGLELHPNYIPASIVLGRCHLDQGDLPAAESAFAHVLRLDDENVIALKSLADINEQQGRTADAKRWLQRLVAVDRSNDEARQQLERLESAKLEQQPQSPAVEEAPSAPLDLAAATAEPGSAGQADTAAEKAESPALDFLDTSEPIEKTPEPALAPPSETPPPDEAPAQLPGLISQEFEPPKEASYRLHPELAQFDAPAEPPQFDVETAAEVELQSSGASEFRVPNAAEDFLELAEERTRSRSEPPPVELPAPVEQAAAEPPSRTPTAATREPVTLPEPVEASSRSYSSRDTRGQSVLAFFQALLAARPAGAAPVSEPSPPRAASSAGEEAPSAPARTSAPTAQASSDGLISFDDFYGSSPGHSAPAGEGSPGNDDLDQFQSWLQNLKR